MLRHHSHLCASRFHAAGVLSHVAGTARNRLGSSVVVVAPVAVVNAAVLIHIAACTALILKNGRPRYAKIRAASMVHPNALIIGAPAVAFRASRVAALGYEAHAASGVKRAGVPSFVIGVAGNRLGGSLVVAVAIVLVAIRIAIDYFLVRIVCIFADGKIRAASVIHPNAPFIRSPTVAFGASGVATLRGHAHSASRIDRTGVASHIVGVAGNRGLARRSLRDE
jgi:hypothetical protein